MTFGSVIRILVVGCLVGPALTNPLKTTCGGFSVRKFDKMIPNTDHVLGFQDEKINLGGWDHASGTFTAPCNGAYFFSFNIILPASEEFKLALMKEDVIELKVLGSTSPQRETNSALVILQQGNKVKLQVLAGTIPGTSDTDGFTSFTGFRIAL